MSKGAISRWSNPETILLVTSAHENHPLVLYVISLARLSKAKVLLVSVVPPSALRAEVYGRAPSAQSPAIRAIAAALEQTAKEFQQVGISCDSVVLQGLPEEEIPRLVQSRSVDRVVVATRNTSGVARLIEEPVAEKLMEALEVPICVIGRRALTMTAPDFPVRRILLAASLHSTSPMLAGFASNLAEVNHAHLTILHVLVSNRIHEKQHAIDRMSAQHKLATLIPNGVLHRFQPLRLIREGDPATIILELADSLSQDLVIIGAPHTSKSSQLSSTRVVHRVVVDSRCPVIAIGSAASSLRQEIRQMATAEGMSTHS